MKVVYLNTSDTGGGAAIAGRRILKALEQYHGVEGHMLVQEKNSNEDYITSIAQTSWQKRLAWGRFVAERLLFLPHERSKEVRFLFNLGQVGTDVSEHPLVQQADLIHLHWVNFGFQSTSTLKKLFALKKPVVWTFHDMWAFTGGCHHSGDHEGYQQECGYCKFLRNPSPNDISHRRWLAKKDAYAGTPFVAVTCSRWLEGRARKSSLLQGFRTQTINNPIDTELFAPIPKEQARQQLGLPTNKELVLFAAMRVNAIGKGFPYFEEALQILLERHPELHDKVELLVFGQADQEMVNKLPLRAHQLGHLSDPMKIALAYNAASMFVTPSLEENLPNTIMESFACGTPVVGFEVGGIPEMIDHQRNGYLAIYRSAKSIAEGIQWVLDHNQEGVLSANARQKVLSTYAEKVIAAQYYQLYQSLL
ncbi:glycosyltransferase family 4 protein [Telluribacter humicola]|uniref:glycosyltransferase family 4 protein n=1 Tax=Telluribacter humicola TaxID=1720261 RepID=UPI001A97C622|nr:glycosyltransferase family 4 protein [Telluribacter humicola]